MRQLINMTGSEVKRVSLGEFVRLARLRRADLKSVRIEMPRLGKKGFGSVVVEINQPAYVMQRRSK